MFVEAIGKARLPSFSSHHWFSGFWTVRITPYRKALGFSMRVPSHPTRIRQMLDSRLKQLKATAPVLMASLSQVNKRCGQPSCACHHGGPLHQAHHLTLRERGKTRTVYVPQDLLDEVRLWTAEHKRLKTILREVSQLTLALVKGHVKHRQHRQGRP
jgi:hypothetical protein